MTISKIYCVTGSQVNMTDSEIHYFSFGLQVTTDRVNYCPCGLHMTISKIYCMTGSQVCMTDSELNYFPFGLKVTISKIHCMTDS